MYEKKLLDLTPDQRKALQLVAAEMIGKKYEFGAEVEPLSLKPEEVQSIDCSELVQYLFFQAGLKVVDGSVNQYQDSEIIDEKDIRVGDLVFKKRNDKTVHVGMIFFTNPNLVIEAEGWYGKVILRDLAKFQENRPNSAQYAGLRRFLEEKVCKVV
jgi:hypothetical protein